MDLTNHRELRLLRALLAQPGDAYIDVLDRYAELSVAETDTNLVAHWRRMAPLIEEARQAG